MDTGVEQSLGALGEVCGCGWPGLLSRAVTWLPEQASPSLSLGSFGTRGRGMALPSVLSGRGEGACEGLSAVPALAAVSSSSGRLGGSEVPGELSKPSAAAVTLSPSSHTPHALYSVLPAQQRSSAPAGPRLSQVRQTRGGPCCWAHTWAMYLLTQVGHTFVPQ